MNEQLAPAVSSVDEVQVTVVFPRGNTDPEVGVHAAFPEFDPLVIVGVLKLTETALPEADVAGGTDGQTIDTSPLGAVGEVQADSRPRALIATNRARAGGASRCIAVLNE